MHETAVAQGLVETICQEAAQRAARPVRAKMSCGLLNAVNDEVLSFAFEVVAKGTACEGVVLSIEHKAMQARCKVCDRVFSVDLSKTQCTHCAGRDFELLPDPPLMLDEIEFEKE